MFPGFSRDDLVLLSDHSSHFNQPVRMGVADDKRFLSWLSQLDEAEPVVPQKDNHPSARYTFDGIPAERQTFDPGLTYRKQPPKSKNGLDTRLESDLEQPDLSTQSKVLRTRLRVSRKEKNGYERLQRPKTKDDRYEYKGTSSRVKASRDTVAQKKRTSGQKRKRTINEDFRASNVPPGRLTLHSASKLGIFNKGKRSSPVKTRTLDQGFSETEFLSKATIYGPPNPPSRNLRKFRMFDYGDGNGSTNQDYGDANAGLSIDKGDPQQQAPFTSLDTGQQDAAVYSEIEISTAPEGQTATVPFSQPSFRHKNAEGSHHQITASSQMEQDVQQSMAGECHAMQLLGFNPQLSDDGLALGPTKRYWTLDELQDVMQQRLAARKSEPSGSMPTPETQSQDSSRKRKHHSSEESEESHTVRPKKKGALDLCQIPDIMPSNRSWSPPVLPLSSCPRSPGCFDLPLGSPPPAHEQLYHATERSFSRLQRPCPDLKPNSFCGDNTSLVCQAFDAAYEAIISEQDTPVEMLDHMLVGLDSAGNPEGSITSWLWDMPDKTLEYPSQMRQETPLDPHNRYREPLPGMAGTRQHDQQLSYLGGAYTKQECRSKNYSPSQDFGRTLGPDRPEANKLALDIGPLTNFWRQNKLY